MSDQFNYRWGETNPVRAKILTAAAVGLGDMLGQSSGQAYSAADESYAALSTAQYNFAAQFLGVAGQRKSAGTAYCGHGAGLANRLRVATEGVFEFDCPATTFDVGDLVAVAKASGSALDPHKVEPSSDLSRAVGRVAEPKTVAADVKVKVRIFSKKYLGGPQS